MVSRILQDESYTGTLICHKSERNKINKTFRVTAPEEQFRHENFLPPIISKELWEQTQCLLSARKRDNVRAGPSKTIHRYSGLLRCRDCGRTFVGKRIKLKSSESVEYICDTYLRYGKEHCTSHAVEEATLDRLIEKELRETKQIYQKNWNSLNDLIERWIPKESLAGAQIKKLSDRAGQLEEEVEAILMERIRDAANAERYDRMIQKREAEVAAIQKQIDELQNISQTIRDRQAKMKRDISLIDNILAEGRVSEAHLRMLVERIYVHEGNGKLDLEICLKAPFRDHVDTYENGEQIGSDHSMSFDFDRLGAILLENFDAEDVTDDAGMDLYEAVQ